MIDYQDLFHVGIRVPDLDIAMDELGASLGVTWSETRENPTQSLWTPTDGLQEIHLRYTYSAEGPQHIELLQGNPGSFWTATITPGRTTWASGSTTSTVRRTDSSQRAGRSWVPSTTPRPKPGTACSPISGHRAD